MVRQACIGPDGVIGAGGPRYRSPWRGRRWTGTALTAPVSLDERARAGGKRNRQDDDDDDDDQ